MLHLKKTKIRHCLKRKYQHLLCMICLKKHSLVEANNDDGGHNMDSLPGRLHGEPKYVWATDPSCEPPRNRKSSKWLRYNSIQCNTYEHLRHCWLNLMDIVFECILQVENVSYYTEQLEIRWNSMQTLIRPQLAIPASITLYSVIIVIMLYFVIMWII